MRKVVECPQRAQKNDFKNKRGREKINCKQTKEGLGEMEKYYCEKCRLIYNEKTACRICGSLASNKIWIEVQKQDKD
ncbi:hypothetical protein [Neobacillus sp. YIM B06451]|uniref:hypothetical protein n=1 Tax=Neobacillus sp. YIM B06451 TaxID=3070994 RepID=UPI0029306B60|nr:hypothetical protein [Neobacillus sp. YIM B06451]